MRNLKFHYISAKNILCFGPEGIQIRFEDYGNIVQVRGINLDAPGTEHEPASNGSGKCFGINTPILMFDGSVKLVQDIVVGDIVMGNDSTPRNVLSLSHGQEMLYEVKPKKGDSYIVNESHILTLKSASVKYPRFVNNKHRKDDIFNIPVKEYINQNKHFKFMMKGYRAGVNFEEKHVMLDPYILGVWLGDGTASKPEITTTDDEIKIELYDYALNNDLFVTPRKNIQYSIFSPKNSGANCGHNFFRTCLKLYHLWNNKHIPKQYLCNSRSVRLQVLAGLLDTDGHYDNGGFEIVNKSEILADNILFLSRSLGLAAYKKLCIKKCQNGFSGKYWRIYISGDCSIIPTLLPRKKSAIRRINKDPLKVGIKVSPIGVGDYFGFSLDGNQLFLLGDFTVVHNSSIPELLSIALYGKMVKNPKKNKGGKILNVLADKGEIELQWDDYRIVRSYRKTGTGTITSKLHFWEDPTHLWSQEKTFSSSDETQLEIDKKIGLSHHAFCNVIMFDDSNTYSFLEADLPTKRQIIENLLDLEQYRDYHENAKLFLKDAKRNVDALCAEYSRLKDEINISQQRIDKVREQEKIWKANKATEIERLIADINTKSLELTNTNDGEELLKWQKTRERLTFLTEEIESLDGKRSAIVTAISKARENVDGLRVESQLLNEDIQSQKLSLMSIQEDINKANKVVNNLKILKEGTECPVCHGRVNRLNYEDVLNHSQETIEKCNRFIGAKTPEITSKAETLNQKNTSVKNIEEKIEAANEKITTIDKLIKNYRAEIQRLSNLSKPESGLRERTLESTISVLNQQLLIKKQELEGDSPYVTILDQSIAEKTAKLSESSEKELQLKVAESDIPYWEYLVDAFGDNGIRKFIIDGIIPTLNEEVGYWLQILIGDLIEVKFDNKLEETITRKGNPANYSTMSKGELRRINLAVPQGFAYGMMLNFGCCPNLIFLDEITGGGIDKAGVPYVFNMIMELAKDRQVFVTTHNETLASKLQGCDMITLKKENDITVLLP